MKTLLQPWPAHLPRNPRPIARVLLPRRHDARYAEHASDEEVVRAIRTAPPHYATATGILDFPSMTWSMDAAGTANASSASEVSLLTGYKDQPIIEIGQMKYKGSMPRRWTLDFFGTFANTGTPTMTFNVRASTTQGASTVNGTQLATSAAITTGSGVSNKHYHGHLEIFLRTPGEGSGAATLYGDGWIASPGGFASPFFYTLSPGAGDSATVTATLDGSQRYYLNITNTWSASSSSNTTTLQGGSFVVWN